MAGYALIDAANALIAYYDEPPEPGEGQRVVERPDLTAWSQMDDGFLRDEAVDSLITVGRFKLLLTQAERIAIRAAAKENALVEDFLDILAGFTQGVSLTDPNLIAAIGQMQAGGLLTSDRAAAVLAGEAP